MNDEQPKDPADRHGDEIVVAGQYFRTGTPVVLWSDTGGYDAYLETRFFEPSEVLPSAASHDNPKRYDERVPDTEDLAARVRQEGWTLRNLRDVVRIFVIHYDVCVTSRECFRILHDVRGLSVPFMLDLDGTVYQTLDLRERGRHSGPANNPSIGIEIAHIGTYPDTETLDRWYQRDETGQRRVVLPPERGDGGVRTPGFVAHPARDGLFEGTIHGRHLVQYDFTEEQYRALTRLTAAVARALPRIRLDAPRDSKGEIRNDVLNEDEVAAHEGLVGHWHLTTNKIDPGPAFDWERVLREARELVEGGR